MEEVKFLKELGFGYQMEMVGAVLLFSFIVKVLYQSHVQRLLKDISNAITKRKKERKLKNRVPSVYELMSPKFRRIFDYVELTWSYAVSLACLLYFFALLLLAEKLFVNFELNSRFFLYLGALAVLLILTFLAVKNGNKLVHKIQQENTKNG
ncbi:hypothetical protein [Microbulbifer sp. PSTR4-B]|jgi:hypothetical protein|uniref:hypothetical protein n=1 Tax=Microbulbifer sp. PSTR4-B TaxID=3243396 RepID=UPI0040397ACC